ncbi:MAG: glutamine--fructose-6-phosphate transaminase (isomerizing) [Sulfolobales archaeon]|nr:glutamine--fructose-6-phosphate transaminase (isomerizing) [Sulfolobales archaeon]MDW8082190.1 glutamine--fructose-6-phosphate transaminase (isomerizing) [Sulfolobales archaeon]
MGGFIFIRSNKNIDVLPLAKLALSRMEFRGKDCSGIAWIENSRVGIVKDSCPISELFTRYSLSDMRMSVVLGHTRYSTHGKADSRNAHPHTDCEQVVAVAGDGAIRNYEELYAELVDRDHRVVSKSDFELVAHLVEDYVRGGLSYARAFAEAVARLEGIVAIAALFRDGSAAIYTSHQPVYVGLGGDVVVVSSTLSSLYSMVSEYTSIEAGELIFISSEGKIGFAGIDGNTITKSFLVYNLKESLVDVDGFPHHMMREIYEAPYSILRTASAVQARYLELASKIALKSNRFFVIANGTSLHAGFVFSYYLSELAGKVPVVVSASEFPLYYLESVGVGDAVLAISQSGETSEVVRSAYEARLRGATVIGVTNNINSRLTRFSNIYLSIAAGPELAVPATKTFTSTLTLLYILARSVSEIASKPTSEILSEVWREVEEVYRVLLGNLDRVRLEVEEASKSIANCSSGYVVSRGITYPLALEGALKIKEAAYIHAEGVEGGELRHGPIAILDRNMFTIFIEPLERGAASDMLKVVEEVLDYGSPTVLISHTSNDEKTSLAKVRVPSLKRHFMPISIAVAIQLLAYSLAVRKGVDVDKPRRLSKVVRTQ